MARNLMNELDIEDESDDFEIFEKLAHKQKLNKNKTVKNEIRNQRKAKEQLKEKYETEDFFLYD